MNAAFLQTKCQYNTHIKVLVFYLIVHGPRDRGGRGAIVSWIAGPPAPHSHHPHCLSRDYLGCTSSKIGTGSTFIFVFPLFSLVMFLDTS